MSHLEFVFLLLLLDKNEYFLIKICFLSRAHNPGYQKNHWISTIAFMQ